MFVPDHLGHDQPNEFTLYGFTYKSMAHWITIQNFARRGAPFKHLFKLPIKKLPPIKIINVEILEEGLEAMLPIMDKIPSVYANSHHKLGIGTTKLRLKYGDPKTGKNIYGKAIKRVLKRRKSFK